MSNSWAQFEANLRRELGRGASEENATNRIPSASALLKKNDLFKFGSGSVSNLLVVSCHICGILLKPAFLGHHVNKIHGSVKSEGTSSASGPALPSSNPRHTPPPKQRLFKQPLRPPIISQIINEEKQFFRKKEPKATKPAAGSAGGGNKGGRKQGKKGGAKKKGPKSKNTPKPAVKEDAEADAIMRPVPLLVASPPPSSPPSLYPSPPRLAKRSKTSESKAVESKEDPKLRIGAFDFKSLVKHLPKINESAFYQTIPSEVTREHRNGLIYQNKPARPLGSSTHGGRRMGSGQVVFSRHTDNLRAALDALIPSQTTHTCTCEVKSQETANSEAASSSTDVHSEGARREQPDYSPSFSSSRQTSPSVDRLLDMLDPDLLDRSLSDDFLADNFSWSDYTAADTAATKLSSKPYAPPPGTKPNIPKLKVDTNQIKSNSAMAVFEFDDPEEGRRAKEEERLKMLRGGGSSNSSSGRKNKRKIAKSPGSQAATPKSNGPGDQASPSAFSSKRGRYEREVIELDPSPTPPSTSPLKHCVSSPRQFSYMVGYGEQNVT